MPRLATVALALSLSLTLCSTALGSPEMERLLARRNNKNTPIGSKIIDKGDAAIDKNIGDKTIGTGLINICKLSPITKMCTGTCTTTGDVCVALTATAPTDEFPQGVPASCGCKDGCNGPAVADEGGETCKGSCLGPENIYRDCINSGSFSYNRVTLESGEYPTSSDVHGLDREGQYSAWGGLKDEHSTGCMCQECHNLPVQPIAWWAFDEDINARGSARDKIGGVDVPVVSGADLSTVPGYVKNALWINPNDCEQDASREFALQLKSGNGKKSKAAIYNLDKGVSISFWGWWVPRGACGSRGGQGNEIIRVGLEGNVDGEVGGWALMTDAFPDTPWDGLHWHLDGYRKFPLANPDHPDGCPSCYTYLPTMEWVHVVATLDNHPDREASVAVYVNGEWTGGYEIDHQTMEVSVNNIQIGTAWGGAIDELMIFDRALTECEVGKIYDAGRHGMCHNDKNSICINKGIIGSRVLNFANLRAGVESPLEITKVKGLNGLVSQRDMTAKNPWAAVEFSGIKSLSPCKAKTSKACGALAGCAWNNKKKVKTRCQPKICCLALTADCLACMAGMSEEDYCAENPGVLGCPDVGTDECATGEEYDGILETCVAVSCDAESACEAGEVCMAADPPRMCARSPCPQFDCYVLKSQCGGGSSSTPDSPGTPAPPTSSGKGGNAKQICAAIKGKNKKAQRSCTSNKAGCKWKKKKCVAIGN